MDIQTAASASAMNKVFLIINCIILAIEICSGPLIMRLYFIHGDKRIWFSNWLETDRWPITFIPLCCGLHTPPKIRRDEAHLHETPRVRGGGNLTGLDDYMYTYDIARLPVSTSSLIIASQLAFTAVFAFFLVNQKFTAYSVNVVVLLI